MKVLLVEPPFHAFMRYDRWYFPTSLCQLAAVLERAGHEVAVYDADKYHPCDPATKRRAVLMRNQRLYHEQVEQAEHPIWWHFRKALAREQPEVVGVSVLTCKLTSARMALRLAKADCPSVHTCAGGAHVTALPQSFLSQPAVDAVFLGWGDDTLPRWLADGCPQGAFDGRSAAPDLGGWPYPRRVSVLCPERYAPQDWSIIMTSRGCPCRCSFCSNGFMSGYRVHPRAAESVRRELRELKDSWRVRDLLVTDPSFTEAAALDHFKAMAGLFAEFGLPWSAQARWASMTPEILTFYRQRGCYHLGLGLESGSDRILAQIRKGCTVQMIREKAALLNSLGFAWQLFCIIGFPDETAEEMRRTRDLALELAPSQISLNALCPLPGTEIYQSIPGMTPERAAQVSQLNPSHCFSRHVPPETFQQLFLDMLQEFEVYNDGRHSPLRGGIASEVPLSEG